MCLLSGLFESFVVRRSKFVRVGSSLSNSCSWDVEWHASARQRTIGPVLFIIDSFILFYFVLFLYVDDIPPSRGVPVKLFADDKKVYTVLQYDRCFRWTAKLLGHYLHDWSKDWQLKFSPA
jgi:hypothetical protein